MGLGEEVRYGVWGILGYRVGNVRWDGSFVGLDSGDVGSLDVVVV